MVLMDKNMVSHGKSLKSFFVHWHLKKQTNTRLCTKLCILGNLKRVDGWTEMSIYKSTGITGAMTDGSTCGTKAIWTDGWIDEWTDRWMELWTEVDGNDKWVEDECCTPSHTKNTWPSKPLTCRQNLFKDTGVNVAPYGEAVIPVW